MSADQTSRAAVLNELYPSPEWDADLVIDDPGLGRLEIVAPHEKVRGKGIPMPPTAYVTLPSGGHVAPKWLPIDRMLRDALRAAAVSGEIVRESVARYAVRWTPSTKLVESVTQLVEESEPLDLPQAVTDAVAGFAPLLVARVDLPTIARVALDALGISAEGPVVLRRSDELDLAVESALRDYRAASGDRTLGDINLRVDLDTVLPMIGLVEVKVSEVEPPPSGVFQRYHRPDRADRRYRSGGQEWLVRPAYLAADDLVSVLALRAGVAALPAALLPEEFDGELPTVFLAADSIAAVPALSALVAPGLRIAVDSSTPNSVSGNVISTIAEGAFYPEDPVDDGRIDGWILSMRDEARAARRAVTAETHTAPLALIACTLGDLPGLAGTSERILSYALELDEKQSILPWWEAESAVERHDGLYDVDATAYQRELAGELLRATRPEITQPVRAASERLMRLADEIAWLADPALGEAAALGCPDPVLRTLRAPLAALLGVLRAATEEQLMSQSRAGELALAAIGAALEAESPTARAEPNAAHSATRREA